MLNLATYRFSGWSSQQFTLWACLIIVLALCKWSIYNSKDLLWILTKIDTDNCLWMPYKCIKFQLDWSASLWVTVIFSSVRKDEEEKKRRKNSKVCSLIFQKCFTWFSSNLVCSLSPLVGGHLHNNFGVLQIKDHGVTKAWKSRLCWSC